MRLKTCMDGTFLATVPPTAGRVTEATRFPAASAIAA